MISVNEALEKLFALAKVTQVENVQLKKCLGRVLAVPLEANRNNPPEELLNLKARVERLEAQANPTPMATEHLPPKKRWRRTPVDE